MVRCGAQEATRQPQKLVARLGRAIQYAAAFRLKR
jgi:hypothetical protein